jgi:hypothetical protein
MSTNSIGIADCLGLNAEKNIELSIMLEAIEKKISMATLISI